MTLDDVIETSSLICLSVGIGLAIGSAVIGNAEVLVIGVVLMAGAAIGLIVCVFREDMG